MYYIRNIEDEKLEIHFNKSEYQSMPDDKKKWIKSNCLFSGQRSCWRSRAKLEHAEWRMIKTLKEWGFEDEGSTGEKLSFAEKVEREQERASEKLNIYDSRHDKAARESNQSYEHSKTLLSVIPMGQPILVGHHSERGHRNLLAKADNAMRKSIELDEKAEYYRDKYNSAQNTAEGTKYKNMGYLVNRIKECNANINTYKRRLEGKIYYYSPAEEISEKEKIHWNEKFAEETDKLDYMTYCLSQLKLEKQLYDKETLSGKTKVKINGRWKELVKCNPKSVAVANGCFDDPALARKYALKYNYGEIQEAI